MKAVIMAGGEGRRLRPMSLGLPKPMVPLFDKPVMEHIIALLRRHGFTDICVTLCYRPQSVMEYFRDGAGLGVRLSYFIEEEPLGTAGSVKNCMEQLGEEDFLVISGDAVCDLNLTQLIQFHQEKRAAATLALYQHPAPLEYGLVLTGRQGRVQGFVEKPGWGQVVTNQVNTGIYVLSRRAMDYVPQGRAFDFGKNLFPLLLRQKEEVFGTAPEGYWCDMGDCKAGSADWTPYSAGGRESGGRGKPGPADRAVAWGGCAGKGDPVWGDFMPGRRGPPGRDPPRGDCAGRTRPGGGTCHAGGGDQAVAQPYRARAGKTALRGRRSDSGDPG